MTDNKDNNYIEKTFFGRRKGKGMSRAKEDLIAEFMPKYEITLPTQKYEKINLASLFDFTPKNFVFEIGYGDGEHLIGLAKDNPDTAFIGCEVFINGNASILKKILDLDLKNIRLFPNDVNLLFSHLPDEVFSTIYTLYPDPWRKNRNQDRRLIRPENLPIFARLLTKDGNLFIASDHPIYIPWVLFVMQEGKQSLFRWGASRSHDFTNPPSDWVQTRYEQKALVEGRTPIYLNFIKK